MGFFSDLFGSKSNKVVDESAPAPVQAPAPVVVKILNGSKYAKFDNSFAMVVPRKQAFFEPAQAQPGGRNIRKSDVKKQKKRTTKPKK